VALSLIGIKSAQAQPGESDGMSDLDPELAQALSHVIDPEVGLDVVSLGLVYSATRHGDVACVELTMTTPACPQAEMILDDARVVLETLPGIARADVELAFEPRWTPDRISEEGKRKLGWQHIDEETA
jgi:metal-sulfur cluster biosynthetic enzyme